MAKNKNRIPDDATVHHVSLRSKRPRPKPKLQPPLTPMIDVTFQLLLYFLLTTTFRIEEGQIPGTLPQKGGISAGDVVQLQPVRVTLRASGADRMNCVFEVSGHNVGMSTPAELYNVLMARKRNISDELPVIIMPRADVRWRFVVEAFNQVVRAKFKEIGFASSS